MKIILGSIEFIDGDAYIHKVSRYVELTEPDMSLDEIEEDWIALDHFEGDVHVRSIESGEWVTLNKGKNE
jgi:hypothetical protein